jgi:hypothetical protein
MTDLLTTAQAAELCGVTTRTITRWCRSPGGLHHGRIGRPHSGGPAQDVIAVMDLAAWLRRCRVSDTTIERIEALTQGATT